MLNRMLVPREDGVLEWQPGPPAVVVGAHEAVQEADPENGVWYRAIIRTGEIVLPNSWEHHARLIAAGPFA